MLGPKVHEGNVLDSLKIFLIVSGLVNLHVCACYPQLFLNEVKEYEPKVNAMVQESQDLVDSNKLDKTDIDGVDKTKNALDTRWKAVNDHLKARQQK